MIGKILRSKTDSVIKYKYWRPVEDYFGVIIGFKCECLYVAKRPLIRCPHCGSSMRLSSNPIKSCDSRYMDIDHYFNVYNERGALNDKSLS